MLIFLSVDCCRYEAAEFCVFLKVFWHRCSWDRLPSPSPLTPPSISVLTFLRFFLPGTVAWTTNFLPPFSPVCRQDKQRYFAPTLALVVTCALWLTSPPALLLPASLLSPLPCPNPIKFHACTFKLYFPACFAGFTALIFCLPVGRVTSLEF